MARCAVSGRTDALPTNVRGPSVFATASSGQLVVREVGVFNTTATACAVALYRATAAGTVGTALTEENETDPTHTILGTGFNTHTGNATAGGILRQASLGAAIGAGVIWTFGDNGLVIPEGTANGVFIGLPVGVAQHLDFYFIWDE